MAVVNYKLKAAVSANVEWDGTPGLAPATMPAPMLDALVFLASHASPELIEDFLMRFDRP